MKEKKRKDSSLIYILAIIIILIVASVAVGIYFKNKSPSLSPVVTICTCSCFEFGEFGKMPPYRITFERIGGFDCSISFICPNSIREAYDCKKGYS